MAAHDAHPVWLFDGVCVLCSRSVQLMLRYERDHELHFVAIQSQEGRALAEQHQIDPDNPSSFIFVENGTALVASDAVLAMLRHTRWPLRWLRIVKVIPRRLRDKAYYWVAQNRYQLFGRNEMCMMPDAKQKHRFVM